MSFRMKNTLPEASAVLASGSEATILRKRVNRFRGNTFWGRPNTPEPAGFRAPGCSPKTCSHQVRASACFCMFRVGSVEGNTFWVNTFWGTAKYTKNLQPGLDFKKKYFPGVVIKSQQLEIVQREVRFLLVFCRFGGTPFGEHFFGDGRKHKKAAVFLRFGTSLAWSNQ